MVFSIVDTMYYAYLCESMQPGTFTEIERLYPKRHSLRAAAECGYYLAHKTVLPEFEFIESVIDEGNGLIFVHKDTTKQ